MLRTQKSRLHGEPTRGVSSGSASARVQVSIVDISAGGVAGVVCCVCGAEPPAWLCMGLAAARRRPQGRAIGANTRRVRCTEASRPPARGHGALLAAVRSAYFACADTAELWTPGACLGDDQFSSSPPRDPTKPLLVLSAHGSLLIHAQSLPRGVWSPSLYVFHQHLVLQIPRCLSSFPRLTSEQGAIRPSCTSHSEAVASILAP